MPLATTRWPGHRSAVDRDTLRGAVDIRHRGKDGGHRLPCVAGGIFVDAGHVTAAASHHGCVVDGIDRDGYRAGGSGENFFTAGVAADRQVVAHHRA